MHIIIFSQSNSSVNSHVIFHIAKGVISLTKNLEALKSVPPVFYVGNDLGPHLGFNFMAKICINCAKEVHVEII